MDLGEILRDVGLAIAAAGGAVQILGSLRDLLHVRAAFDLFLDSRDPSSGVLVARLFNRGRRTVFVYDVVTHLAGEERVVPLRRIDSKAKLPATVEPGQSIGFDLGVGLLERTILEDEARIVELGMPRY